MNRPAGEEPSEFGCRSGLHTRPSGNAKRRKDARNTAWHENIATHTQYLFTGLKIGLERRPDF